MIEHLVLFKLKAGAPTGAADALVAAFRGLKGALPGVVDLTCGRNFSERAQGFDLALTVRLESRAALAAYAVDAKHVDVITRLVRPNVETVLAVDYEI